MSIPFSRYKAEDLGMAGYFRIGHIVLSNPPLDITANRVANNDRLTVLRGSNDMFKKTGQSRWDFTVRWIALQDDQAVDDEGRFKDWEDLRSVVAIFKAAPFVEVENGYIRQVLSEEDPSLKSNRLGFALRQMQITTHADIIDALDVSLTMTLFNYQPYSKDFGYLSANKGSTDAYLCDSFKTYIDRWKDIHLDGIKGSADTFDGTPMPGWKNQFQGTCKFKWRTYTIETFGSAAGDDVVPGISSTGSVPSTGSVSKADINATGKYDTLIQKYAKLNNISPAMAKAIVAHESSFKEQAIQPNLPAGTPTQVINSVIKDLRNQILSSSDGGRQAAIDHKNKWHKFPDIGLMQLNYGNWFKSKYSPADLMTPDVNLALGCQYLGQLYSKGMTDDTVYKYNTGGPFYASSSPAYVAAILKLRNQYAVGLTSTSVNTDLANKTASTPVTNTTQPVSSAQNTNSNDPGFQLTDNDKQRMADLAAAGWQLDHWVNHAAFFYQEQEITFTDEEHGDIANIYKMFPTQVSVMLVNNLAQIPLAGYSYPTYQHIGSASSRISVSFMSKGERETDSQEPSHLGISKLSSISDQLDAQYLRLRNTWRRVDSVHRMQAVYVQNQILNLLGIRGMLLESLAAETMSESSDLAQVQLVGSQYENIFENTDSYKINSISQASAATVKKILDDGISSLSPEEVNVVKQLSNFSNGRKSGDKGIIIKFIGELSAIKGVPFDKFDSLYKPQVSESDKKTILDAFSGVVGKPYAGEYPSAANRLDQLDHSNAFSIADFLMIVGVADNSYGSDSLISNPLSYGSFSFISIPLSDAKRVAQNYINSLNIQEIQSVYDTVFPLLLAFNSSFASEVNTILNSPKYSQTYRSNISPNGPGADPVNAKKHGAYRDFGDFSSMTLGGDFNPGFYFYNHNNDYVDIVSKTLGEVIDGANNSNNLVNKPVHGSAYDVTITDQWASSNADKNSLVKMTNVPGYSMAEAFPTFKLFLIEDSSQGLIQAFDNFYSYASVLSIEIIRYRDKPDLAQIQISNLANILSHKLLDDSLMGRREADLLRKEFYSVTPYATGPVQGQDPNSAVIAGKTASAQDYQRVIKDRMSGYNLSDGFNPDKTERIPLQYIGLQPGTKIQIRMGYSDNPDQLVPVFTGQVTDISGDEILTIEAESYLAELCTLPVRDDKPVSDKVYGGINPFHDAGDVPSIIEDLIKCDNAKHFGRFQLKQVGDYLVQGMTWETALGQVIGAFSCGYDNTLTKIGTGLSSSFDRSKENILINHVINNAGIPSKYRGRSYLDQTNTDLGISFHYSIPENCTRTTWDLIRDVARRYPEYIVACKQYGFPFGADATLVVGHPLDWYFARPHMPGDAERYRTAPELKEEFTRWMDFEGKKLWNSTISTITSLSYNAASKAYPTTPQEFEDKLTTLYNANFSIDGGASARLDQAFGIRPEDVKLGEGIISGISNILRTPFTDAQSLVGQVPRELLALRDRWYTYVQMQHPTASDLLKPIRKTHYIDHQTIIHNGMKVNDKIYNAIRLGKETIQANNNIPHHHVRVLDCTDLVNNFKDNVEQVSSAVVKSVAQSFLKEEIGKMYEGDIILRSVPEIEPYDLLVILDPSTAMTGIVEVDKVIHSFDQEQGAITIVTPRCVVAVNESVSANAFRMMAQVAAKSLYVFNGFVDEALHASLGAYATVGAAAGGTALLAWGGVTLFGGPPAAVVVALLGTIIVGGIIIAGYKNETNNPVLPMPITRWGRPWMGGLEGYEISDISRNIANDFVQFKSDEIYPLIQTYRQLKGMDSNTLPLT